MLDYLVDNQAFVIFVPPQSRKGAGCRCTPYFGCLYRENNKLIPIANGYFQHIGLKWKICLCYFFSPIP
jgi:hypothetical protein